MGRAFWRKKFKQVRILLYFLNKFLTRWILFYTLTPPLPHTSMITKLFKSDLYSCNSIWKYLMFGVPGWVYLIGNLNLTLFFHYLKRNWRKINQKLNWRNLYIVVWMNFSSNIFFTVLFYLSANIYFALKLFFIFRFYSKYFFGLKVTSIYYNF